MSVQAQRAALDTLYRAHAHVGMRYALVDFPDHANVGDSAIWLGERQMLRTITGRDPCYVSTWHDFDAAAFRAACPDGTLFLHGGGNLGDIWPHHQRFREHVVETIDDRPVVQLPQSIQFRDPATASRFAAAVAAHPDFTLYVRDRRSRDVAHDQLRCAATLAPDSALALNLTRVAAPECAVLMLLRGDDERRDHDGAPPPGALVVDWLEDAPDLPATREEQAVARVARGVALLSRGAALVTDRLHGHILATLLGIPHVVLDNDYGKLAAYLDAWPQPPQLVRHAATVAEADRIARAS